MLKAYKQKTYEGCLPSCLLILEDKEINKEIELEIIYKSLEKNRDNFYAYNNLSAFSEKFARNLTLFVDIREYANYLNKNKDNALIKIIYRNIDLAFLLKIKTPYIVQIDDFVFGDYVHATHYIIVESINEKVTTIIDPWYGSRKKLKTELILNAIKSLKNHLLFSPLLITLDQYE